MEVRRGGVGDVRQDGELSAVRTTPANPEGSVPRRRAELVHVVEYIPIDGIGTRVSGSKGAAFECRAHILVMSWSENIESVRVENRQKVGVGLCDDVFNAVDLVRRMGGWDSESRHVGRQSYAHVVFLVAIGGHADGAFEESGELLEVSFAWVAGVKGEVQLDPLLCDGLLALGTGLLAHVPYLAVLFDVEFVVEAQAVKPMNWLPFVSVSRGDTERTRPGAIENAGKPWGDLTANIELYRSWLLGRVIEGERGWRLEGRHAVLVGMKLERWFGGKVGSQSRGA